jgi:hypothetical protein
LRVIIAVLCREQMAEAGVNGIMTADVFTDLSNDTVLTTAWINGKLRLSVCASTRKAYACGCLSPLRPPMGPLCSVCPPDMVMHAQHTGSTQAEQPSNDALLCPVGEKLSESRASDIRELCNTLLSAYLIQLLDTGLLHADPHPGNLIRTEDGKICVLDFGLMTEVTPTQRIALFEYIAHLSIQVGTVSCYLAAFLPPCKWLASNVVFAPYVRGQRVSTCAIGHAASTPTSESALGSGLTHDCGCVVFIRQDWGKLAYDLQRLGFIPDDVGDEVLQEMSGPLGRILVQLSGGGGATKLNIDAGEGPC